MTWLSAMLSQKGGFARTQGGDESGHPKLGGRPTKKAGCWAHPYHGSHSDPGICREYRLFQQGGKGEVSDLATLDSREQNRYGSHGGGRKSGATRTVPLSLEDL
jgi:hypothetical protein